MKNKYNYFIGHPLYNDDDVLKEFSLLHFDDYSYKNDELPCFGYSLGVDAYICIWLGDVNHSEDYCKQSTIMIYNEYADVYKHIYDTNDIWELWSIIRSNLNLFNNLVYDICDICSEKTIIETKLHSESYNYYNICDKKECDEIVKKENKQ